MVEMEDSYLASSSSGARSGDGVLEARFSDLCKFDLALDEDAFKQAMTLLTESRSLLQALSSSFGGGTADESERFWFACVLFSVKRLGNTKSLGLSQIIRATKLNVVDFCKEMPQFFLKAGHILGALYGVDWEKKLEVKEMQANFVHLSVLSNYYKRAYESLFMAANADHNKNGVAFKVSGYLADYHRFGWLLFILLRVHAFGRSKDLVTCTTALVSVLGFLIVHVPVHHRKFSIGHCPRFVMKSEKGVDLIKSLCHTYQTSEDETRSIMDSITKLIEDILKRKPCLASECKADSLDNLNADGLVYFDGLLEGESLSSSLLMLETHYHEAIHDKGELDERMFVNDEDSLLGSGSLSGGCMNLLSGTRRKFDDIASPAKSVTSPLSPLRSCAVTLSNGNMEGHNLKAVATPVSTAMVTAKWLRTVISPLESKPSVELQRYLSSCDTDLKHEVIYRAHVIMGAIFPYTQTGVGPAAGKLHNPGLMDSIWAQQRRMEALKLYYRVLESMCRAESRILHGGSLTSLLSNERFHRCMLACSAELVLATHKTITMLFPAVLEKTGITAFDLSKVIESFVRHEETLPRELKRHLNSLEERLLENMAWEKGSSMYNSLIVARPVLAADISRMGLLAEPMPSLDSIAALYNIRSAPVPNLPPPSPRKVLSSGSVDQNGGFKSPERPKSDNRSVLGECKSFNTPVKDGLASASPMKDNRPTFSTPKSKLSAPLQSAFDSPTRLTRSGGETCAEIGIQVFFSKILKLIAIRTKCLCERLQLPHHVLENIYCFIQQILNQRTPVFFNRHIDQLILCSIYGVAKISEMKLTFKEIIGNYRKQPHCKPQVFRSVFIDWSHSKLNGKSGQDHVDVITFYNEIFIPSVKPLLVELGPATANFRTINDPEGQCPESPRLSPFPPLPDISPKKISTTHNVYVSPLRSSKMEKLISPSSKSYYACVGESTHSYQSPSKDLTAINNRLKSERKVNVKLNFDVGLVSDSMVASSLYPQNSCTVSPVAPILSTLNCEKTDS